MNGSVAQWAGVILPENFVISLPRTPSRVIWFGHVRFMPVGLNAPWKLTSRRWRAAARAVLSYHRTIHWSWRSRKSIFTPFTPQRASFANVSSTPLSCSASQWSHTQMPTPFSRARAMMRWRSKPLRISIGTSGPWFGRRAQPYHPPSIVW